MIRLPHAAILNFTWRSGKKNARGFIFSPQQNVFEKKSFSRHNITEGVSKRTCSFLFDGFWFFSKRTVERVFSNPKKLSSSWEWFFYFSLGSGVFFTYELNIIQESYKKVLTDIFLSVGWVLHSDLELFEIGRYRVHRFGLLENSGGRSPWTMQKIEIGHAYCVCRNRRLISIDERKVIKRKPSLEMFCWRLCIICGHGTLNWLKCRPFFFSIYRSKEKRYRVFRTPKHLSITTGDTLSFLGWFAYHWSRSYFFFTEHRKQ